jgi:ribosomal-protein-alanine N-acetyltransferase
MSYDNPPPVWRTGNCHLTALLQKVYSRLTAGIQAVCGQYPGSNQGVRGQYEADFQQYVKGLGESPRFSFQREAFPYSPLSSIIYLRFMIIETPRLIIRELTMADEAGMFEMDNDPEVHKYLGNRPYTDIQQSRDNIAFVMQQYNDNGIGRWAVELKDTGEFIGWTGFKLMTEPVNGHVGHYDFGYRHMQKHWGKGYAREAAKASLDYGIEKLGFSNIYAMTDPENKGSRHILEKLGFTFVEIFDYDGPPFWRAGNPITWYKL